MNTTRPRSPSPLRRRSPPPARQRYDSLDKSSRHRSRSPRFRRSPSPYNERSPRRYSGHEEDDHSDYSGRHRRVDHRRFNRRSPSFDRHRRTRYRSPSFSPSRHHRRSRSPSWSPPRRRRRRRRSRSRSNLRGRPSEFVLLAPIDVDTTEFELQTLLSNLSHSHNTSLTVLRDKLNGNSRQAALIRFPRLENAKRFVSEHIDSGIYIGSRQARPSFPPPNLNDWTCMDCNYQNLWHSFMCSKCGCAMDIDVSGLLEEVCQPWAADGSGDISHQPTCLLILRGLDSAATEQTVYDTLKQLAEAVHKQWIPVQVRLMRSKANDSPLGFAFAEYESVEVATDVYTLLTDKSLYPSGFFILSKAVVLDYAKCSAFATAYATSAYTVVVPGSLRIVAFHQSYAYAVGYPVPDLEMQSVAKIEDPLAAFYAEIGEPEVAEEVTPPEDSVPTYTLIQIPSYEDFIDRQRKLCCLCRRVFKTAKHAVVHSFQSPTHLNRLQNDLLAQQVAMILKYRYKHPPAAAKKKHESLESGIGGQLLAKLGWTGGGLGRQNDGITQAIEAIGYTPGAGIGAGFSVGADNLLPGGGAHALDITRKRYLS